VKSTIEYLNEKFILTLRNFISVVTVALLACATANTLAVGSDNTSSENLRNGMTWVEVDNGTPMNVDEFNQHTEGRERSTFCNKGECDSLPHLVKGNAPEYPIKLLREEITGQVVVAFTIDIKGRVVRPEIQSATRPEFAKSVITAISAWEFSPAMLHGKPIEIRVQQIFPFVLR